MLAQRIAPFVLLLACFAGCTTVRNAHEAQKTVAPKGSNTVHEVVRHIDLRGKSLSDLVAFALTNRPSVVSARLAVESARLKMKTIAADAPLVSETPWTAPKLSISGGYAADSEQFAHRIGWPTEGNASSVLSLDLLLWDFGRNSAKMRAAAENVLSAEQSLLDAGYAVFDDVTTAYFNSLEADAILEVCLTNELEYAEHLRQAEDMLTAGEAKRLDVTRARLDLAQARQTTVAASNTVMTSGIDLITALGMNVEEGTRYDVLTPVHSGLALMLVRGFAPTTYTTIEAFDLARTNAPTMAIARAKLRSASASVDAAIADLLPTITASASLNWADPLWFWQWGVSAAQSLFTGFRKTTAIDSAVVDMKSAAAAVDTAEHELSLSLGLAIAERDNATEARTTALASIKAAQENYETMKEEFRYGEASRVDFTDAVSDYATSVGSCVKAFYRGQIAEAKLFVLTGRTPVYREEKVSEVK